jgi:hydrogenase-4 membrane subunit HyfE
MNTLWKYLQYGYLIIAIIFLVEAILGWNDDREKSYLMIGFSVFITLVFFFKRFFRKKVQSKNKQ